QSIPDGLSQTVFYAEKYNRCGNGGSLWGIGIHSPGWMAMFAYKGTGPAARFQVTPNPCDQICDSNLAQTPHPGGMLTGMGDGSVRSICASVSGKAWWDSCTPAGNEVLGNDWND